jgi:photosystem II stability/assembly factor-like uncharacterized protein
MNPVFSNRVGWVLVAACAVWPVVAPAAAQDDAVDNAPAILAPLANTSLMLDAALAGDRLVAVGDRGHILVSDDSGATWSQVEVPTRAMLTGITFVDDALGFAVGHDAVILRTRDAGNSWEVVHFAPEEETPFLDVWFENAERGFVIGAYGYFFVTTDGGDSWNFEPIGEDDFHLYDVKRAGGGRLYMAAEAGFAYRSEDTGTTWEEMPSPYEGTFFGTLPLNGDTVLLFGLRGHLFRSEDGGDTWQELDTGTVAMLTDGIVLRDGSVLIVGLGGTALVSSDEGRSFELVDLSSRLGSSSVITAPDGSLVVVGEGGPRRLDIGGPAAGRDG